MGKVIKEAKLVCVSLENNSNKLYWMSLFDNDTVRIQYGRYIETSSGISFQHDDTFPNGEKLFNKKLKEKLKPGRRTGTYVEQPVLKTGIQSTTFSNGSLEQIALQQIKTTDEGVHVLIKNLVRANVHNVISNSAISYDVKSGLFSTPTGLISKEGIDKGRSILSSIKDKVDNEDFDSDYIDLAQQFMSIVPRDIGRRRVDPSKLFPSDEIQKQLSILDSLEVSLTSILDSKPGVEKDIEQEKLFDLALHKLADVKEYNRISKYYESTAQSMHYSTIGKRIENIYVIHTPNKYLNFNKGIGNIKELFHGSSQANVLSILKSGLKVSPPSTAHIAGKLLGNGVYSSDISTKALNYALGYWGGGCSEKAYMFLCDVALGNMYTAPSLSGPFPPNGYDSVFGKAGYTGSLLNNEYVVYNENNILLKYLIEII